MTGKGGPWTWNPIETGLVLAPMLTNVKNIIYSLISHHIASPNLPRIRSISINHEVPAISAPSAPHRRCHIRPILWEQQQRHPRWKAQEPERHHLCQVCQRRLAAARGPSCQWRSDEGQCAHPQLRREANHRSVCRRIAY